MISPDTVRTAIGIVGNVVALVRYLSPAPTFYCIWKKRSVEQYSATPYVATLLSCMLWLLYGLPAVQPRGMALVIVISVVGIAIQLVYLALYLAFSAGAVRRRVVLLLAAEVTFIGVVALLILTLAHTHERRAMIVGILIVLIGTGMYAAPLTVMKMVIKTKSVEYMPLFLSLALLANGICWTAYALIRFDLYLTITSGLGMMFAIAQLILYAVYYKSTQQIVQARKVEQVSITQVVVDESSAKNNPSVAAAIANAANGNY
uniref:Bidirectional sugar transporter SWEET n=1 Tax=Leersia perrieri TaxID=77586 RepID=A0A0D9WTQ5_9ORYZ